MSLRPLQWPMMRRWRRRQLQVVRVPRTRSGTSFGGSSQSSPRDLEQPGWATKLTRKVKKLFCLQTNIQHHMYEAHVREKKNRLLQYEFYRKQGMTVEVGSEENITPEDRWISKFSNWDLDDDVPGPSSSAPPVADEPVHDEESKRRRMILLMTAMVTFRLMSSPSPWGVRSLSAFLVS